MAQSDGDELEQLHKDLADAFQRYALSDPAQFHDRTGTGFKIEAEHFVLRAQSLMHKWERADCKQHELDAKQARVEKSKSLCGCSMCLHHSEAYALKAEREELL